MKLSTLTESVIHTLESFHYATLFCINKEKGKKLKLGFKLTEKLFCEHFPKNDCCLFSYEYLILQRM